MTPIDALAARVATMHTGVQHGVNVHLVDVTRQSGLPLPEAIRLALPVICGDPNRFARFAALVDPMVLFAPDRSWCGPQRQLPIVSATSEAIIREYLVGELRRVVAARLHEYGHALRGDRGAVALDAWFAAQEAGDTETQRAEMSLTLPAVGMCLEAALIGPDAVVRDKAVRQLGLLWERGSAMQTLIAHAMHLPHIVVILRRHCCWDSSISPAPACPTPEFWEGLKSQASFAWRRLALPVEEMIARGGEKALYQLLLFVNEHISMYAALVLAGSVHAMVARAGDTALAPGDYPVIHDVRLLMKALREWGQTLDARSPAMQSIMPTYTVWILGTALLGGLATDSALSAIEQDPFVEDPLRQFAASFLRREG